SPIVGPEAVRAQVAADVDFSQVERTSESYDPEMSVLRSEQISEDQTRGAGFGGVPGALANQPPPAGVVAPEIAAVEGAAVVTTEEPLNSSRRSTRNYEVDRTISHVKQAPGSLRRLSVAVVVDHRERVNEQGAVERVPLEPEELERITALVREAVGFDARRGDSVNVINASFRPLPEAEPMPEMPVWQEPWIADLVKWTLAALVILILALFVLRPMLRNLTAASHVRRPAQLQYATAGGEMEGQAMLGEDRLSIGQPGALPGPKRQDDYEVHMETARSMAREDPKRVAQVVKTWLQADGT
ncbi:MAG: flagellar basal-body MS-ring/collar protein FliF, partial [Chromatiales bacterium]|nr:flagellar basal-body MS-ring/collar protein FliF [Chromatiales bacterium]